MLKVGPGGEAVSPCPSCRLEAQSARRLIRADIPSRYAERGFETYSVHHPSQEEALKKSIDFVERFPRVETGLLFVGPCGVGKTHLAVAILKAVVSEKKVAGQFIDEAELLRRLQYSYGPDSPDTEREVMLPLMKADLLVWDDLGTGRPTEWVRETTRMVLNHRYTGRKITILTSNWPFKAARPRVAGSGLEGTLEERIGSRLFSRIMEMCEVVEVDGPDARTEIHKAGRDFQRRKTRKPSPLRIPASLLKCPQCGMKQVEILDQGGCKKSSAGESVELSCVCRKCSNQFVARFMVASGAVEYPGISG